MKSDTHDSGTDSSGGPLHGDGSSARVAFYRELLKAFENVPHTKKQALRPGLTYFRERILPDPDALRRKIYGANILRVQRLDATRRRMLRALEVHPDLLSPLDDHRYEPSHSRLLGYFLSEDKSGGVGRRCLQAFLRVLNLDDSPRHSVQTEYSVQGSRVDVRIETTKHLIYLEMKIDAIEGDGQLAMYRKGLELEAGSKDPVMVFLTLPGAPIASSDTNVIHLQLDRLLRAWLALVDGGPATYYLAQYLKSVALVLGCASLGSLEDWPFSVQRQALTLVEDLADVED